MKTIYIPDRMYNAYPWVCMATALIGLSCGNTLGVGITSFALGSYSTVVLLRRLFG